jgi:putative thioredoxin
LIEAANDEAANNETANNSPPNQATGTDSPDARLTRAARALFDDQPEQALTELLALAQHTPIFREDIGRRAMIALFGMLGSEHELTRRFRARLAELSV